MARLDHPKGRVVKVGDRLQVIDALNWRFGQVGTMTGLTRKGNIIVEFIDGDEVVFHPHDLEMAPVVMWGQTTQEPDWRKSA